MTPIYPKGDGYVPPDVRFLAKRNSGNLLLSTVEIPVEFPDTEYNNGNGYNTNNDDFTAQNDGLHVFIATGQINIGGAGTAEFRLYHGSTQIAQDGDYRDVTGVIKTCVSAMIEMLQGEKVEVRAYQDSGYSSSILNSNLRFYGAQIF